jgi:hypothetical protein
MLSFTAVTPSIPCPIFILDNYNLLYNERNEQLLLRQSEGLCCINLDGHVIYRYDISGFRGLAVDQRGYACISGYDSNDIP